MLRERSAGLASKRASVYAVIATFNNYCPSSGHMPVIGDARLSSPSSLLVSILGPDRASDGVTLREKN